MGWRKLVAVIAVLWLMGCGLSPWLLTEQRSKKEEHTLSMDVLCDTFEMAGYYQLEFDKPFGYLIENEEKNLTLDDFECLIIDAGDISINGWQPANVGIIEIKKPEYAKEKTKLIFKNKEISDRLYIERLEGRNKNATITFSNQNKKQCIRLGDDLIAYVKKWEEEKQWDLVIEGECEIIQEIDGKKDLIVNEEYDITSVNKKVEIKCSGSLGIVAPKIFHESTKEYKIITLSTEFNPTEDINALCFKKNEKDSSPVGENKISLRPEILTDKINQIEFKEVKENDFLINMADKYYEKYKKGFSLKNIISLDLKKIENENGRFRIALSGKYSGNTYFPKVLVTTRYFRKEEGSNEEKLVEEISYPRIGEKKKRKFFFGEKYIVYIEVKTLVKNKIEMKIEDINSTFFEEGAGETKTKDLILGAANKTGYHRYSFEVKGKEPKKINCRTKVWTYDKKIDVETDTLDAEIDYNDPIYVKEIRKNEELDDEKNSEQEGFAEKNVNVGQEFDFEIEIGLREGVSSSIEAEVFIIPDKKFTIEKGQTYLAEEDKKIKENRPRHLNVSMKAPMTDGTYKIHVFVYYRIGDSYHNEPIKETKDIIVGMGNFAWLTKSEGLILISVFITSICNHVGLSKFENKKTTYVIYGVVFLFLFMMFYAWQF